MVQNPDVNRDAIIAALRAHEPELKAAGVVRLSLFGSTSRDAACPGSDIDLLAAFDEARPLSLLDVIRIENQLADLLGQPVDQVEEGTLKPRVRRKVDREAMGAFWRSGSALHRYTSVRSTPSPQDVAPGRRPRTSPTTWNPSAAGLTPPADFRRLLASRFAARTFSDRRAFHLDWSVCDWAIDE